MLHKLMLALCAGLIATAASADDVDSFEELSTTYTPTYSPPSYSVPHLDMNYTDVGDYCAVVPEPSTYALMTLGLLGLGVVARRRKADR
ncbi:MAG: PEP-CTERM sorting domain-containing protein [Burkholderiaceae bacterium]